MLAWKSKGSHSRKLIAFFSSDDIPPSCAPSSSDLGDATPLSAGESAGESASALLGGPDAIGQAVEADLRAFGATAEGFSFANPAHGLAGVANADGVAVGGHNVKGFDLPMLINRARVHGLKVPANLLTFWKGRPTWHDHVFDTLEILSFGRSFDGNGVDDVARVFGLPPKLGHGGDFTLLWRADREGAVAYNRRDVEIEIEIARICGCV